MRSRKIGGHTNFPKTKKKKQPRSIQKRLAKGGHFTAINKETSGEPISKKGGGRGKEKKERATQKKKKKKNEGSFGQRVPSRSGKGGGESGKREIGFTGGGQLVSKRAQKKLSEGSAADDRGVDIYRGIRKHSVKETRT